MLSQFSIFIWNTFNGGAWSFGPLICQIYAAAATGFGTCSICTMAAIAYDRYNVIAKGVQAIRLTTGKSTALHSSPEWHQSDTWIIFSLSLSRFLIWLWNWVSGLKLSIYILQGDFTLLSSAKLGKIQHLPLPYMFRNGSNLLIYSGKSILWILLCWIYAIGWSVPPFFGWGAYIPDGILDHCSFDYLSRDLSVRHSLPLQANRKLK